jgi:hypothetical protein
MANIKWWLLIRWWAARIKLMKGYLPGLILAIGFQVDGGEWFAGLGRWHGGLAGATMGNPNGVGLHAIQLPFLEIRRTMWAHLAGLGAAATIGGRRAVVGPWLQVPTMMAARSKGWPTSLLGQTDAVQCPEALCRCLGFGFHSWWKSDIDGAIYRDSSP